jgi:glutamate racemase
MGTQVHIINSAQSGALKLQTYLERHPEIEKLLEKSSVREFFTTDSKELFEEKGKIFYGKPFQAEKIKV